MNAPPGSIGVCDWGIGGLGFYRRLRCERPDLDVVYLGDQGATPYGLLSRTDLAARMDAVFGFFAGQNVPTVVVACNAASTVLGDGGIIAPTLRRLCAEGRREKRIGVIGGRRAIRSGAWARPLRDAGFSVTQRIAQPLSARIERGETNTPETHALLAEIVRPLARSDRLILACTHYVAVAEPLRDLLPGVEIIDPVDDLWSDIAAKLPPATPRLGRTRVFTTGDDPEAMRAAARVAFGVALSHVERTRI